MKKRHRDQRDYMKRKREDPEFVKKYRAASLERYRKRVSIPEGKTHRRQQCRDWNAAHRDLSRGYARKHNLKQFYGLSVEQYDELFARQNGMCAICRQPETVFDPRYGKTRRLAVDHSHETGCVRGLLCVRCNQGLGHFNHERVRLIAAIDYLAGAGT